MGFMDELKKLTRPYDEDEDDFLDEAEVVDEPVQQQERPRTNPFSNFSAESASLSQQPSSSAPRASASRPREGRVVNLNAGTPAQMQVVLIKPERFETAAEIADHLRSKRAVLVNMEDTPKEITRRLVDFLSGVTYALDGNIRKVASNTYILTPSNINLVSDQMDELEASSVYF